MIMLLKPKPSQVESLQLDLHQARSRISSASAQLSPRESTEFNDSVTVAAPPHRRGEPADGRAVVVHEEGGAAGGHLQGSAREREEVRRRRQAADDGYGEELSAHQTALRRQSPYAVAAASAAGHGEEHRQVSGSSDSEGEELHRQQRLQRLEDEIADLRMHTGRQHRSGRWSAARQRPTSAEPTGKNRLQQRPSVSPPAPEVRRPHSQAQLQRPLASSARGADSPASSLPSSVASSRSTRPRQSETPPTMRSHSSAGSGPSRGGGVDGGGAGQASPAAAARLLRGDGDAVEEQIMRLLRLGRTNQQIMSHYAVEPHGVMDEEVEALRRQLAQDPSQAFPRLHARQVSSDNSLRCME